MVRKIAGVLVFCLAAGLASGAYGADREALRAEAVAEADRLAAFTQQMVDQIFSYAELGYQELIRRVKESAEPLTKYGDFLVREKKDPVAAIEQYRQALIWSPGDDAIRAKLADIFLTRGVDYFNDQQFAMAEALFAEAAKYIAD